jgi:hypothetical protein
LDHQKHSEEKLSGFPNKLDGTMVISLQEHQHLKVSVADMQQNSEVISGED